MTSFRVIKNGYLFGVLSIAALTGLLLPFRDHVNSTTFALILLLMVLITAVGYGSHPAFASSIFAMLAFNFFFLPPYHTFTIADPQNWVALFVFLVTALIAGSLSAREKRRAEEADSRKKEVEKLYVELQEAFEKASQAEALKQSEQLKSALLDAVTHDLRTPLTSMKAAVTTLLAGNGESSSLHLDRETKTEMLDVIDAEIDRLNRFVESLIEMARIEAGAMHPQRSWSNIEEIISIALNRTRNITAGHQVRVNLKNDLPLVRIDQKSIAEVLYNLIENAAKYSDNGTEIIVTAVQEPAGTLKIAVEDHGAGIPVELREKVFDKFFRASPPGSTPRAKGLGMGLAIARGIVEAHQGRIWIEDSSTGRGTRVCFTIKLREDKSAVLQ